MKLKILFAILSILTFHLASGQTGKLPGSTLNQDLKSMLDTIYNEDQNYRIESQRLEQKYGWNSKEVQDIWKLIHAKDSVNLIKIEKILTDYGWLGADALGERGNTTIFLVIQHSDHETQLRYLPVMREAVKKGNARAADLALLEDRVAIGEGQKQIYGSQLEMDDKTNKYVLSPMIDPDNVDKRRAEVGLQPLSEYLKFWNLTWDVEEFKKRMAEYDSTFSGSKLPSNEKLKIYHLSGDYYIFTTYRPVNGNPFPSNGMYCVTKDGVVMLDTPWDTTQFQPLLDSITARHHKKVMLCISTHYHDDRTAGLEFLKQKGVKTYSSKLTYDLCKEHHEKQAAFYFINDTTFVTVEHTFQTYYPGEGHTKDNIVIWCRDAKILYGGCLVKSTESQGLGNLTDANVEMWGSSIRKVMKKYPDPDFVIPGHMGWESNKGLQHTLGLLKQK